MRDDAKTGGPAYPTIDANRAEDYGTYGMTMRDYFAAKAMQALFIRSPDNFNDHARYAYEIANAMLAARSTT